MFRLCTALFVKTDNRSMRYLIFAALMGSYFVLQGCSPTFNWRDVRLDGTSLTALFPCKPDQGTRQIRTGGQDLAMTMLACDAAGVTFTLAFVDAATSSSAGALHDQWKVATLAAIKAQTISERSYPINGASASPPPVRLLAQGSRPDGSKVSAQAAWFSAGSRVFQAVLYAESVPSAEADTYFSSLRLP